MKIVVYGLCITSSWGNGHATTYRSLLRALAAQGHIIVFVEKNVPWYRDHRDMPQPDFCSVVLYECWELDSPVLLQLAADADIIVVGSYFPDAIAASHALFEGVNAPVLFYDIDTPLTLAALRANGSTAYLNATSIPQYAAYLSFSTGPLLTELQEHFGARSAVPLLCSVDPELYTRASPYADFGCDLSYLGTYAPDRQPKLMTMLDDTARRLPSCDFLVAGPQYPETVGWNGNVRRLNHVAPADHAAFYSSSRFTINLTRADMVAAGYSPSVRLFEASACGATILSDHWKGIDSFLTPGEEILLPADATEVVEILTSMSDEERVRIGSRARERVLAEHTSAHRAREFEAIVSGL